MNKDWSLKKMNQIIFTNSEEHDRIRLIFFSALIFVCLVVGFFQYQDSQDKSQQKGSVTRPLLSYDTLIPSGYNLVPIEIANAENIQALIEDSAVVDLFIGGTEKNPRSKKVANQVRLLRAPKNPNLFAILCKRSMTESIMNHTGPFWVSVLNPDQDATALAKKQKRMRIITSD
ncbi:MAG: hypothetical protein VX642_06070 [Bdellovibrionota bacterium]|nr:hypothetical protein [Bdellovibrionota bacterium]